MVYLKWGVFFFSPPLFYVLCSFCYMLLLLWLLHQVCHLFYFVFYRIVCAFCYYGIVLMTTELFETSCVDQSRTESDLECAADCKELSARDYVDLLWTTIAEFPGWCVCDCKITALCIRVMFYVFISVWCIYCHCQTWLTQYDSHVASNELEWMWKEERVMWFKVLSCCLPGGAEECHRKPHSSQPVPGLRFQFWTSQM